MVRTSGGIRISAGKSSKKGGGANGGGNRSTPSTPSGKSSTKGSNRLPPIPYCDAPSWQKPITNFFNSDAGSSKSKDVKYDENLGCSSTTEDLVESIESEAINETDGNESDQPSGKKRKMNSSKEESPNPKVTEEAIAIDENEGTSNQDKNDIEEDKYIEKSSEEEIGKENRNTNV